MNINKKLCRDGFYSDFFSQGVQVGNILTLAGQLGDRADGEIPESIKEQMENCYDNIQNFLKEFRLHWIMLGEYFKQESASMAANQSGLPH